METANNEKKQTEATKRLRNTRRMVEPKDIRQNQTLRVRDGK